MDRAMLLLALAVALAACSEEPRLVDAAPPGVSYRVQGDNVADAAQRADRYCQRYGKHSRLTTVNHDGDANIAVFACS